MKINLIPEVKQEQLRIQKLNAVVTSIAVTCAAVVGALVIGLIVYNLANSARLNGIKKESENLTKDLEVYKDLEKTELSLETGLVEIKKILDGGKDWNKFLGELEKVTPADIQIETMSMSDGNITMSLVGRDVKSIDRFIKSFSNYKLDDKNLFSSVSVDGYSKSENKVTFSAKMMIDEGLLWK